MVKPKILVVDDEPEVVTFIERSLSSDGFDVITAYDGIAALDMADSEQPDLIVLDIMMPMMSGFEVCQQLKANPQTRAIPVLCLTSAHSAEVRDNVRNAGAQALLTKPFAPAELVAQIRRHLNTASPDNQAGAQP